MKNVRDPLVMVGVGVVALFGVAYAFSGGKNNAMSRNVVYGEALRACEEDDRICTFSSVHSAAQYLSSPEHKSAVAMRELKATQNAAASNAASAAIEIARANF